jgi:hypothetical protein
MPPSETPGSTSGGHLGGVSQMHFRACSAWLQVCVITLHQQELLYVCTTAGVNMQLSLHKRVCRFTVIVALRLLAAAVGARLSIA